MHKPEILTKTDAVECSKCHKLHRADSDNYVTVYGNICRGAKGGLVGNNLDENGIVTRATVYCASTSCLADLWKDLTGKEWVNYRG